MVNIRKLRAKMVEAGVNVERLASEIGVDKSTLYRRLAGNGEDFTIKEADLIRTALSLSVSEASTIFFTSDVARTCEDAKEDN